MTGVVVVQLLATGKQNLCGLVKFYKILVNFTLKTMNDTIRVPSILLR